MGTDGGHWLGWRHWLLCWLGDKKLMWAAGYTRIAGTGLGFLKISWGKYLKGTNIFGWFRFDGFAFYWLSTVVLYGPKVCSDTKTDVGQPN